MDPNIALQITVPVTSKCDIVGRSIQQCDAKHLHQFFPHLLANIFGFDSTPGWGLGQQLEKQVYDHLKLFLLPHGPLFKLIAILDNENYCYEFPTTCLPQSVCCSLADGVIPQYYVAKLQYLSGNEDHSFSHISLSAFEYYIFHFAYYLIYSSTPGTLSQAPLQTLLYADLLTTYDRHFLPPQASMQPAPSPSPTKSINPHMPAKKSTSPAASCGGSGGGLGLVKLNGTSSSHLQQPWECVDTWRTECYVQILIEFWLNQISYDSDTQSILDQVQNYFCPTEEHCRLVRNLLKDVHFFSNGSSLFSQSLQNGYLSQATDRLRRSIIPVYFEKKVYQFLRHAFKHWGMDKSFRIVLEIWLTYIQPWRYIDANASVAPNTAAVVRIPLDSKWKTFVLDNLLFYTNLLLQFLSRSFQLDLSNNNDLTLLFRVAKIFSYPGLRNFIMEGESLVCDAHSFTKQSSLRSSPQSGLNGLKGKFVELEGPSFVYQPVFTSDTIEAVTVLLRKLENAKISLDSQNSTSPKDNQKKPVSFLHSLWNAIVDDDVVQVQQTQESDPAKCIKTIAETQAYLRDIFELSSPPVAIPLNTSPTFLNETYSVQHQQQAATPTSIRPDYVSPNQLSQLGRMQVISGLRTCNNLNVEYQGDPVLQPIRSYENPTLVRLLYQLSTYLNNKFSSYLTNMGRSHNFVCKLGCQLLTPSHRGGLALQVTHTPVGMATMETVSSTMEPSSSDIELPLHPRINLRVFASYYTFIYVLLLFLLGWLLGYPTTGLLLFFGLFLYMVVSYNRPKHKHQ